MQNPPPPFVAPPPTWVKSKAIKAEPGTRWFVERGPSKNFKHWLRELHEHLPGDLIPMQWVPQFVGVTRGAVKKRLDGGGLTGFSFVVVQADPSMLGSRAYRETKGRFDYLVVSECEHWREQVMERLDEKEQERLHDENEKRQRRRRR